MHYLLIEVFKSSTSSIVKSEFSNNLEMRQECLFSCCSVVMTDGYQNNSHSVCSTNDGLPRSERSFAFIPQFQCSNDFRSLCYSIDYLPMPAPPTTPNTKTSSCSGSPASSPVAPPPSPSVEQCDRSEYLYIGK